MKYIVCDTPGKLSMGEKSSPIHKSGEALLKIDRVGICGTDLHAYQGNQPFFSYPRILGHELAATVIEIEENDQYIRAGDSVIIMPYQSCSECIACRKGKTNCCTDINVFGVHVDGGMQEMISYPIENLMPAGNLNHKSIAVVEPLAIGAHGISRAQVVQDEVVLVVGCGPIGVGIIKQAKIKGARVIAMDTDDGRLRIAQNSFGADFIVSALHDPLEQVREITSGDLATAVFDATGNIKALNRGIDYLAHGGRYVLVGLSQENLIFHHPSLHSKEGSILCSRNATMDDFRQVKRILEAGLFPIDHYITHEVHYTDMITHYDSWLDPKNGVMKAMVTF